MSDEQDKSPQPRIRPEDILKGLRTDLSPSASSAPERRYLEQFRAGSIDSQVAYAHLQGIRDHYRHKGRWSNLLMLAIASMIGFQSYLLWEVGKGRLDFTAYEWLLPALLVQNLGQIVGLSVYAVRYLFSDISNQKLK